MLKTILHNVPLAEDAHPKRKVNIEPRHPKRYPYIDPSHPEFISGSVTTLEVNSIEQPSETKTDAETSSA